MLVLSGQTFAKLAKEEGVWAEGRLSDYAGSQSCQTCHAAEYKHWQTTAMARFVRDREALQGPLPGNWDASVVRQNKDRVRLVVGIRKKAAFVTDDWHVIPYQYNFKKMKWQRREDWAKGDQDYRTRCGSCHLTGLNRSSREFVEMGIGCEACHGPAARHVESQKATDVLRVPSNGRDADLGFCGRCHNQRNNHSDAIKGYSGRFHR